MKNQSKSSEPKIRFNEAEKIHISSEANRSAEIYFDSFHDTIKDLPKNISDKVTKDVTEVINPVIKTMFDANKKMTKRVNRMEMFFGTIAALIIVALIWLAIAKAPKATVSSKNKAYIETISKNRG